MLSIIPRDTRFFDLLEEAGTIVRRAAEAYAQATEDGDHRTSHVAAIQRLERDGSDVAHRTFDRLDTTFITPFDREDIYNLIRLLYEVVNEINTAARRLESHRAAELTSWLHKQSEAFLKACYCVGAAVPLLRNLKRSNGLRSHLAQIRSLESEANDIYHAAMAELWRTTTDPIVAIKWKELYNLAERAIDRCEVVADTIEIIAMKNA